MDAADSDIRIIDAFEDRKITAASRVNVFFRKLEALQIF